MTNAEAFAVGWVYGRIVQATGAEPDPNAARQPYTYLGRLMVSHAAPGMVSSDLSAQIGAALASIDTMDIPIGGETEAVQPSEIHRKPDTAARQARAGACAPSEIQSAWSLGYFSGFGGRPLDQGFDIAAARKKKKLTQAKLAEMMGVDQGLVSRWESGKVTPNAENMRCLREILK